jgi:hypothetical protein
MDHPPDFNRISPTAMMTCLARQFTDIPLAREMGDALLEARLPLLPLVLEARHKAIDAALAGKTHSRSWNGPPDS